MTSIHHSLYRFMHDFHAKQDSVAVISGNSKMTFRKLFDEIDRVAAGLYAMGVRRGSVVMLALPNILQNVVAVYALSRIGAVAAMIHPLFSADQFAQAVEKLKPEVVFLSDVNLKSFWSRCGGAKRVICPFLAYAYIGLKRGRQFELYEGDGEEDMFYMQSGGTSGSPKTIALSSRAVNAIVANLCATLGDRFSEHNRMLCVMPMFHGFGLCVGVHASLSFNMTAVLMARFDADKAMKVIAKRRVTNMIAVPRMVSKLLAHKDFKGDNISSIQEVYVGGDSISDRLVSDFEQRIRDMGGNARILPGYGLTETVTVCALTRGEFRQGSVGAMLDGMEARVVDDDLNVLPVGERGELLIAGDQLMTGYFGDEEATKAAFVEIGGKRYVRSGDLVSMDEEGRIYFLGRKKRLIKISGMNVFPSDIESVAQQLDYVKECVALEYKVGDKSFIRLLVEGELTDAQKKGIISHIAKHLSHWNIPSDIVCVERFPRTQIGKVDAKALMAQYGTNE